MIKPLPLISPMLFLMMFFSASIYADSSSTFTPPPVVVPVIDTSGCGKNNQAPCTITAASFVGNKASSCPGGSLFDPIDGGTCWQCPAGTNRTVYSVKTSQACEQPGGESLQAAQLSTPFGLLKTDCAGGAKWDPSGVCWSCPSGYNRTGYSVRTNQACSRHIASQFSGAQFTGSLNCPAGSVFDAVDGGSCWTCPSGYSRSWSSVKASDACVTTTFAGLGAGVCNPGFSNIRGVCQATNDCGTQNKRPCEIGEKIPSCDAGLKENFKQNICTALRPGETPFLGGLSSATDYYGDWIRTGCKQAIAEIRFDNTTNLGVGANCSKDIFTAVSCEFIAKAAGAEVTDQISAASDAPAAMSAFVQEVDRQYLASPCNILTENLKPATRHGAAAGTNCPGGQFWDPDGSCYSCPQNYTRTLNSVTSSQACVDKPAAGLARSACSVYQAVIRDFAKSAACTTDILQSGVFTTQPINFEGASTQVCLATGEMVYAMYSLVADKKSPEKKGEKLIEALNSFGRAVNRAGAVVDAGNAGLNLASGFDNLLNCR